MAISAGTMQSMTMAGLNLIQQAISIYDSELTLVVANARFQEMFNIPKELMTPGASFEETIRLIAARGEYGEVDDLDAMVKERVERALAFEPHYIERQRTDGRWISVEGNPLPDGGWVAVYTDITRIKRQEALLRSRSEELSDKLIHYAEELSSANRELASTVVALEEAKRQVTESEQRMRLTTEMLPAHIAHIGADEVYTYSNRRLSAVMPGRPSNIVGRTLRDTLGEHTYARIENHLGQAFGGTPQVFEFTDAPSSRRIRLALTPDSEQGANRGFYILSMDVTEETQTRAALQQTRRRELAAQMTSGLAHDFSNLLTIIMGMQSRLEKMPLIDDARSLVNATLGAARRGGTLLDRIADMTTQRAPQLAPVAVKQMLTDLQTLAGPSLQDNHRLVIKNDTPDKPMLLDPGMLQDSLLNLILNARDACVGKGIVTVQAAVIKDTWLQLEVTDTGDGFSEKALAHALDPFFTTKGSEGSGLGLPMVYDTIKMMGGQMAISNLNPGAKVTLKLPLKWVPEAITPGLALLVEDEPELRDVIRDMLTQQGHTVIEAASVDEALILLEQVPDISLVLSDINLEGAATGVDLVQRLDHSERPTFLMTSLSQSDPLYIEGAALAPIIRKPFDREALAQFLRPEVAQ